MNFQTTLILALTLASCLAGLGAAVAPPLPLPKGPLPVIWEQLIQDLAAHDFSVREAATQKILVIGESALPGLERVEYGKDPEQAFRARELIRKIELSIAADTDPAIVALVERYLKATSEEKMTLLNVMRQKRAWRQILKLFAREKEAEVITRYQDWVGQVSVIAARECLAKGDAKGARDFLEMAPADGSGLLALADFHRSQGTWDEEMKRARLLDGPKADAWKLALYRVAGKLDAARDAAVASGEMKIAAGLAALTGDPLPWLKLGVAVDKHQIYRHYTEPALLHWSGQALAQKDLEPLLLALESNNAVERQNGIAALFLLGQASLAEAAYAKEMPLAAFTYFESLQRIPEALRCLGLDPAKPDYSGWVAERFTRLMAEKSLEVGQDSTEIQELAVIASFLELRGKTDLCDQAFRKPLATYAAQDSRKFTNLIRLLLVGVSDQGGAARLAINAASDWAGQDAERWDRVVRESVNDQDQVLEIWNWLAELDPVATLPERFNALLALFSFNRDPTRVADRWMTKCWQEIDQTPVAQRGPLLMRLQFLTRIKPDVANSLRIWAQLSENQRSEIPSALHVENLAAAGRWDEAAVYFLREIEQMEKSKLEPQPAIHAYAASALRRAGREKEAVQHDRLAEMLALGRESAEIATSYEYGADFTRAAVWWQRAVVLEEPGSDDFQNALKKHSEALFAQKQWEKAAAVAEIRVQMVAGVNTAIGQPVGRLRLRLSADLARAMAYLPRNRPASLALLEQCYQLFPTDGSLADDFFPVLRQAGLRQESRRWFQQSWDAMCAVIVDDPDCDNLLNTTAWLASRAEQNLGQAEKFLQKALVLNPDHPAYLDTMAEIQLAMGNPAKALDWSRRAVNFMPLDPQIRQQYERFRTAALFPRARR